MNGPNFSCLRGFGKNSLFVLSIGIPLLIPCTFGIKLVGIDF